MTAAKPQPPPHCVVSTVSVAAAAAAATTSTTAALYQRRIQGHHENFLAPRPNAAWRHHSHGYPCHKLLDVTQASPDAFFGANAEDNSDRRGWFAPALCALILRARHRAGHCGCGIDSGTPRSVRRFGCTLLFLVLIICGRVEIIDG